MRGQGQDRGRGRGRGRKSESLALSSSANDDDSYERKIIHREVERHRRQEMSNLYNSLRSVLPSEYTKGKRSISDHVGEAVNYIKNLKKNVKELEERRDMLKNSHESSSSNHQTSGLSDFLPENVSIYQVVGGLAIEIRVNYDKEFSLAIALQVIHEEGLSVATCNSTKIKSCLVHNIVCEVCNVTCIDVSRLQQRLIDLVC